MPALKPTKTERRILIQQLAREQAAKLGIAESRYQPGDVLEQPSGAQYEVLPNGSWKRIR